MTTVKKTHWLRNTLIVLIVCGLIGTTLAAVLFFSESNQTYATAAIQFSFDGVALKASGLEGTYTAEQLRGSMNVTGVYPERIAEQMTKYVSLLDTNADMQAALSDYHATRYSVTLYNNFDPDINSGKLTELLRNILTVYRNYFAKTYSASLDKTDPITDLQEYDYAQQLEAIRKTVNQDSRYALEIQELAPDFILDGKSFGDIAVWYQNLGKDIDRLEATITLNAVSKDRTRLQKRYEMEIRTQGFKLESLTEELRQIEKQVNAFEKDGIIYVSANGVLSQVGSTSSDTYDTLVEKRKSVSDQIAEINATIALYQARLDDMTGVAAQSAGGADNTEDVTAVEELTAAEKAALQADVEKKIETLRVKRDVVMDNFAAMLDAYAAQEINEKTVSVSGLKFKSPRVFSGAFIVKVIKTAGPICAVGFMVCLVLLIISRRKEEKARKAA